MKVQIYKSGRLQFEREADTAADGIAWAKKEAAKRGLTGYTIRFGYGESKEDADLRSFIQTR